jgi:anaerobic magnesium-protoporphyrin IX monomethyl ester cyclase
MNTSWRTHLPAEPGGSLDGAGPKRVLLISIECTESAARTPMLASAYLVAQCRRDVFLRTSVDFSIRQFCSEEPLENIIEDILDREYDLIGFSCYLWNYNVCEQIIPVVKKLHPLCVLVMGGPQTLGEERNLLSCLPELDIVVSRDGELPFLQIMSTLARGDRDWSGVEGIYFRQGGEIRNNSARRTHLRFQEIASPYLDKVITGKHENLYLETYRGCPYTCSFCAWGGDDVPQNDLLPVDRIKSEIEVIAGCGAYSIGFFDANFNQPPLRAKQILDLLLAHDRFTVFGMSIFAQTLREELACAMSNREVMLGVGLQSSDPAVNSLMKRRYRDEKMAEGLRLLNQYRLNYALQLIVGLPGDTYESIAASLNYALSFEPPVIDAFRLMVLPGTEYRRKAEEFGMVYERRPNHYVISHNTMTATQINRAERMAQALNVFYNRPATRLQMQRQAAEGNEDLIQFCDALGTFMNKFGILSREDLRKGNILRSYGDPDLLAILADFKRFRAELAVELAELQLSSPVLGEQRATIPYGHVYKHG